MLLEFVGNTTGTETGLTDQDDRTIGEILIALDLKLRRWHVDGGGQMAVPKFGRLAHVNENRPIAGDHGESHIVGDFGHDRIPLFLRDASSVDARWLQPRASAHGGQGRLTLRSGSLIKVRTSAPGG